MKNSSPYISSILAVLVAFGITLSSVHIHHDDFHDVETEHAIVQDDSHCVICGSIFKFSPGNETLSHHLAAPETSFFTTVIEPVLSPFNTFKDSRAPPSFS